jgi:hypothetical protein
MMGGICNWIAPSNTKVVTNDNPDEPFAGRLFCYHFDCLHYVIQNQTPNPFTADCS